MFCCNSARPASPRSPATSGTCCPSGSSPYLAADHSDQGTTGSVDGVKYYNSGSGPCGLLLLPDVWGWNSGRIRAIADDFAEKGFSVWIPKILSPFEGGTDEDGLPPNFDMKARGSELGPLLGGQWNKSETVPQVLKVVSAMRDAGVKKFGVVGFCYGAWIGFALSKEISGEELVCGAAPHPSVHVEGMLGGDPAAMASECNCPWALYPCGDASAGGDGTMYDVDGAVFMSLAAKFPGKVESKRFKAMAHGFVTRGAITNGLPACDGTDVKAAVQECLNHMLDYFSKQALVPRNASAAGGA
eukprot:TRINITY_DN1421_c0_g1_i6.p1 TRINITY_DN1421_c0_g1~~TRINITY_DN1421_c0_g1_i6.p1  ORF type:complete len:301 (+),score=60.44 TRINITY_DN1421_c0_g1_i6:70-972(+)